MRAIREMPGGGAAAVSNRLDRTALPGTDDEHAGSMVNGGGDVEQPAIPTATMMTRNDGLTPKRQNKIPRARCTDILPAVMLFRCNVGNRSRSKCRGFPIDRHFQRSFANHQ